MATKQVLPIKVDGFTFPMHSTYVFDLKKVYTEEPQRTLNGAISVFPAKIFIPYFTISWAIIKLEDYYDMMEHIQTDEQVVDYYDSFTGEYKRTYFYAQQPTIDDFISLNGNYTYVKNLKIVFSGTLRNANSISVSYNVNAQGSGLVAPTTQNGYNGEEYLVNDGSTMIRNGYEFVCWNTKADGTGTDYVPNSTQVFTSNITLYAKWQVSDIYRLSLNYGLGTPAKNENNEDITSIRVRNGQPISGLPTSVKVNGTGGSEFLDKYSQPVYNFSGWYTLPQGQGTAIGNGSTYTVQGDSSVYANFIVNSYTLIFNSNGGTQQTSISGEYGTKISLPTPTKENYTFGGWYTDNALTTRFTSSTIPAESLTLYAKWN